MQHYFFVPQDLDANRWKLAFPTLQSRGVGDLLSALTANDLVWCFEEFLTSDFVAKLLKTNAKIIVLVTSETPEMARKWLELGAVGYVHYGAHPELLISVAQVVSVGGIWMGADLLRAIVQSTYQQKVASTHHSLTEQELNLLSERELSVARLVSKGASNKEIAVELSVSERTVKAHLTSTFEKLRIRDRLHLALVMPKS